MQVNNILTNETLQEIKQIIHLAARARPVFSAEAEYGEVLYAKLKSCAYRPADSIHTLFVSSRTRQRALMRPAAVAIHNYRDVAWFGLGHLGSVNN